MNKGDVKWSRSHVSVGKNFAKDPGPEVQRRVKGGGAARSQHCKSVVLKKERGGPRKKATRHEE